MILFLLSQIKCLRWLISIFETTTTLSKFQVFIKVDCFQEGFNFYKSVLFWLSFWIENSNTIVDGFSVQRISHKQFSWLNEFLKSFLFGTLVFFTLVVLAFFVLFLHFLEVLIGDWDVEILLAVQSHEDEHPNHHIIAGCDFVGWKELQYEFIPSVFSTVTCMSSQNRQQWLLRSIHDHFVTTFVYPWSGTWFLVHFFWTTRSSWSLWI